MRRKRMDARRLVFAIGRNGHDRRAGGAPRDLFDRGERCLAGVMQIFEHDEGRAAPPDRIDGGDEGLLQTRLLAVGRQRGKGGQIFAARAQFGQDLGDRGKPNRIDRDRGEHRQRRTERFGECLVGRTLPGGWSCRARRARLDLRARRRTHRAGGSCRRRPRRRPGRSPRPAGWPGSTKCAAAKIRLPDRRRAARAGRGASTGCVFGCCRRAHRFRRCARCVRAARQFPASARRSSLGADALRTRRIRRARRRRLPIRSAARAACAAYLRARRRPRECGARTRSPP